MLGHRVPGCLFLHLIMDITGNWYQVTSGLQEIYEGKGTVRPRTDHEGPEGE
jgi:hypothetical protein